MAAAKPFSVLGSDAASRVVALLKKRAITLLSDDIEEELGLEKEETMVTLQELLDKGTIKLLLDKEGDPAGSLRVGLTTDSERAEQQKTKGLSGEEQLVYQTIAQAGNKGIWIKDIRHKTNVTQTRLPKYLKTLEGRNLIKTVKSSASSTKKIYMLFELKPSEALTGGTWYTDGSLDEEFVETMRAICLRVIEQKGNMRLEELTKYVSDKGFTNQRLQSSQIREILQTLMSDCLIDEQFGDDDDDVSIFAPCRTKPPETTALSEIPCGQCPVIHECAEGNDVSPSTCKYFAEWLDF